MYEGISGRYTRGVRTYVLGGFWQIYQGSSDICTRGVLADIPGDFRHMY